MNLNVLITVNNGEGEYANEGDGKKKFKLSGADASEEMMNTSLLEVFEDYDPKLS